MNDELKIEWDIIERSKADTKNFELLYKKYYQQILKFVYKRRDRIEDAYDITAETFGKALANIGKYKNQGFKFSSWLYRIAINEINEFYRKAQKQRTVNIDDTSSKFLAEETGRESAELKQVLKKALEYLDEDELQLLELRFGPVTAGAPCRTSHCWHRWGYRADSWRHETAFGFMRKNFS